MSYYFIMQDFLNRKQVAALLQCHPATVSRLISRGELDAIKIGRSYRVPAAAVLDYVVKVSCAKGNSGPVKNG